MQRTLPEAARTKAAAFSLRLWNALWLRGFSSASSLMPTEGRPTVSAQAAGTEPLKALAATAVQQAP